MKISFKELRKTPFEVKASVKNLKKTYAIQLKLATLEDSMQEDAPIESLQAVLGALDNVMEYVVDMLKLKPAEIEALEDLSQEDVMAIAQRLNMRLMGMSKAEIKKALTETDDDEGLE
ncbi:phage tail assembly chaperone [Weissella confusa]|uniref:phage tail assembly chaperone n=1 Tax=Weissella confusa TaxID=1583 RepID=UPI001C0F8AFD|nr:phage tail assembly chaperone [Weissella confusa]MBU5285542.1 phage tail assembly chaperone [Weissella confusa]